MFVRDVSIAVLAIALTASVGAAWEGARVRRLEHPDRLEIQRQVQVPVLSYHPAPPSVDSVGRVWLHELGGTIRAITPYLGETGRWHFPTGVEAPGIETPDGAHLFVSRDGRLHRIDPEITETTTVLATGLPTATGLPCRSMGTNYWPDTRGGVSMTNDAGELLTRYEDELYKKRRIRGGAAVGCDDETTFVAVAGGKIAGLRGDTLIWAESPGALAGATFAPRAIRLDAFWIACTREELCFAADAGSGVLKATVPIGSFDGPQSIGDRLVIAGRDGHVHFLDAALTEHRRVHVESGALWLLAVPSGNTQHAADVIWVTSSEGNLYRIAPDAENAERVYSAPSGFSTGGLLLYDGTALVPSNFGTTHIFSLR